MSETPPQDSPAHVDSQPAPDLGPAVDVPAGAAATGDPAAPAAGTPAPGEETIETPDELGGTGGDEGGAG